MFPFRMCAVVLGCAVAIACVTVGCVGTRSSGVRAEYERFAARPSTWSFMELAEYSAELLFNEPDAVKGPECKYVMRKIIHDMRKPRRVLFVANENESCDNLSVGGYLLEIFLRGRIKPWYDELSELPPVIFCEWKDEENHRFHVFPLSAENAKAMALAAESWIESN